MGADILGCKIGNAVTQSGKGGDNQIVQLHSGGIACHHIRPEAVDDTLDDDIADGDEAYYPIECLDLTWNTKFASVGHRDLLGAVMGLSIEREMTGDIVLAGEGKAYLFVIDDMADYIIANLESAGRATLKITRHEGDIECPEPEGVRIRITLASPRLDAFVSSGYNLSRSESQKLINAGLVKLNHVPEMRTDAGVNEGDLISVRGHGRMKVEEMLGQTKRGRLAAQVFRYGG
jgi:RNA-binding protein YlmH